MGYNKEYYEANKETYKEKRDKYRNNPENRKRINMQQRERYKNMPNEKKQELLERLKNKRAQNIEKSRLQYRINQRKARLKQLLAKYEEYTKEPLYKIINKKDFKQETDCAEAQDLFKKMQELQEKIDAKREAIAKLEKEKKEVAE